jgi:hypothetical protein
MTSLRYLAAAGLISLLAATVAHAQGWSGVTVKTFNWDGTIVTPGPAGVPAGTTVSPGTPISVSLDGSSIIQVVCPTQTCGQPGQLIHDPSLGTIALNSVNSIQLPIADFANANEVNQQLAQMQGSFALRFAALSHQAAEYSAMAAALHGSEPIDGRTNRLGLNFATLGGRQAAAVNYVHVVNDVDLNAGVAWSNGTALAQAGVGVSW